LSPDASQWAVLAADVRGDRHTAVGLVSPSVGVAEAAPSGDHHLFEVGGLVLAVKLFADGCAAAAVRAALVRRDVGVLGAPRVAGIDLRGRGVFALIDFVRF